MVIFYLFYDILLFLALVLYLPVYALRGRVGGHLWMRLGFFPEGYFDVLRGQDVVWLHAVSVGEARGAESLLRLMRQRWPGRKRVISTVTPTGYEILRAIAEKDETICYAPVDLSFVVRRFLAEIQPSLLVIFETELWPNLIRLTHGRGARVAIVNGRISDASLRRYGRLPWFWRRLLKDVCLFCMQTEEAAERIKTLGGWYKDVVVTGNIKFDAMPAVREPSFAPLLREATENGILWIAGSTHDNEEEAVLKIYKSLRKDFPRLRLLIAPRHLERLDRIRRAIRLEGFDSLLLSRAASAQQSAVLLLDTIGDLSATYRFGAIVFVGGSLVPKGGHNPIEPAVYGKAILFGPHMGNFREIRNRFIKEEAALEIKTPQEMEFALRRLLGSRQEREALGARARQLIENNRGAAQQTMDFLERKAGR
ncbi:MAG: 3-deoxy-D-manno-octulosonic acid transferase [Deltaproteobacteria bacterium]